MDITSLFNRFSIFDWVIILLYVIFFIVQLFYYLYLFCKPYQHFAKGDLASEDINEKDILPPGISIIITAKNEAENLRKNLPFILKQDYPNYQVVVVNNGSSDTTNDVLNSFKQNHTNLYITYIPIGSEKVNDKKLALTVGIKAATHDILLFTEPDTKPLSNNWVNEYAKIFNKGNDVVLGSCQMEKTKNFFNKFILFDNLFFGVKYLSFALVKKPYMGIGRNMAFKKNLFFENRGFSSILNIENGEDNVFINKIVTKENTAILVSADSMMVTNVAESFSTWRNIKLKYLKTQKNLSSIAISLIAFEVFSRYSFYLMFITLGIVGMQSSVYPILVIAILLFLIRYFVLIFVVNKNSKLYNAGSFHFSLLLFDILSPIVDFMLLNYKAKINQR